jgi:hypothetical protein
MSQEWHPTRYLEIGMLITYYLQSRMLPNMEPLKTCESASSVRTNVGVDSSVLIICGKLLMTNGLMKNI